MAFDRKHLFEYRKKMSSGVFSILPGNFFSLLTGANREHYAALLVLYYRLFQEYPRGLERELVVREFLNYLALHQKKPGPLVHIGHHAVLKAHEESRSLIDSLKVLSQSIKGYYDNLNLEAVRARAASALHEHYDLYMGEVLDKAYKRLKTSDNVSRYRQGIFKQVAALLKDDKWLDESAGKYMRLLQASREECRKKLESMLEEIRDDLKSVDPLEDEIDRRNAAYSRSSTEIIKAYIEPDSTVAGKIGLLIKAIYSGNEEVRSAIPHGLYRVRFLSPSTLAFNQRRQEGDFSAAVSKTDIELLEQNEKEFFERMRKRLSIRKIDEWLDEHGGKDRLLNPGDLIDGEDSYIRFIYALLYGDSRNNFGYAIEENDKRKTGSVKAADYMVPDIRFRGKKHEPGP